MNEINLIRIGNLRFVILLMIGELQLLGCAAAHLCTLLSGLELEGLLLT